MTLGDSLEAPQLRVHRNGNMPTRMVQELPLQELVGLMSAIPLAALMATILVLFDVELSLPMLLYVVSEVSVVTEIVVVTTPPRPITELPSPSSLQPAS